jgi:hypothetical protein
MKVESKNPAKATDRGQESAVTPLQGLAEIIERRAAAYRAAEEATVELRNAARAELDRILDLAAVGQADKFAVLLRAALIELRTAFDRDDRHHIDSSAKAIARLAHGERRG